MRLPKLDPSKDYQGLYVLDFGDFVGVGYTAEEVAVVLESERYADARVYKVHRVHPDGTVDLKGVAPRRFQVESAFCFCSRDADRAQRDFDGLRALAESDPLPCRARLMWGKLAHGPAFPWTVAVLYPAEYEDEMSAWLLKHDWQGGETVEAGISHANVVLNNLQVRDRAQLPCAAWHQSRAPQEVLKAVGQALQR